MAIIWETTDRRGRSVTLSDEAWAHVVAEHPDMAGRIDEVLYAIAFANEIKRDRQYSRREVHYREYDRDKHWLRVIVNYRPQAPSGWAGEVITAHFISRRIRREALLWPLHDQL